MREKKEEFFLKEMENKLAKSNQKEFTEDELFKLINETEIDYHLHILKKQGKIIECIMKNDCGDMKRGFIAINPANNRD